MIDVEFIDGYDIKLIYGEVFLVNYNQQYVMGNEYI